jgi:hypothetical protein
MTQRFPLAALPILLLANAPIFATPPRSHGRRDLIVIASFHSNSPGQIDLRQEGPERVPQLIASYRELDRIEPDSAAGWMFTMIYTWDGKAKSFLPSQLTEGDLFSEAIPGQIFVSEDVLPYEAARTRWDFFLHCKPSDLSVSVEAPLVPGAPWSAPVQSLRVRIGKSGGSIELERSIQNLLYVNVRPLDVDGDGSDELILAVATYKSRALYIIGTPGKHWKQVDLPEFQSYAEAEAFLKANSSPSTPKGG